MLLAGFVASLAAVAADLGVLLLGLAALRARVLPWPYRSLPLAVFALDLAVPLPFLLVFWEDVVVRGGPDEGMAAFLAWDLPVLLVGVCWMLLGHALRSGRGGQVRDT